MFYRYLDFKDLTFHVKKHVNKLPSPKDGENSKFFSNKFHLSYFFFKFRHCIFSTCSYLSLQNDIPLHLNKWESPLPKVLCAKLNSYRKSMLCAKNDWNWSKGSGEEDENVYKQTNGLTTDNRRSKSQFQLKRAIQVAANPYKHLSIVSSIIGWKL